MSLRFTRVVPGRPHTTQTRNDGAKIGVEALHEKNLKGQAISNQVESVFGFPCVALGCAANSDRLGESRTVTTPSFAPKLLYPWGNKPFATFNFKHRSRSKRHMQT